MNRRQFLQIAPTALAALALAALRGKFTARAHEGWGQPMQFDSDGLSFPVYFNEHPRTVVTEPRTWQTYLPFIGNGGST